MHKNETFTNNVQRS